MRTTRTDAEWENAKAHVNACKQAYVDLMGEPDVMVGFALTAVIEPLLRRYNGGERTDELYAEMMAAK